MFEYKKVIVIGCSGAGKSTFARKLAEITNLPLHYLDMLYWNADATHCTREVFVQRQKRIIEDAEWILDGNFRNTLELRVKHAQCIFFFDLPAAVCKKGVLQRSNRPDMPCNLPVDDELLASIQEFNTGCRPTILNLFEKYSGKRIITFHSHGEADAYLQSLQSSLEYWDVYDANRNKIPGKRVLRGKNVLQPGEYHLVVHACLFNSEGKMLIQQRQPFKPGFSGLWDITCGGSVVAGETSRQGIHRELLEEVGVDYDFSNKPAQFTVNYADGFDDYYLITKDVDAAALKLQYEEVKAVEWATCGEIENRIENGSFIPYSKSFIRALFDMRNLCGVIHNG